MSHNKLITIISIVLPIAVAALFGIKIPNVEPLSFLPPIYAAINGLTAILLVCSIFAIKQNKRVLHERLMKFSLVLSILFLIMYVAYHMTSEPTTYGGTGILKLIYFFVLISHIILSVVIIPLVLLSYVKAISGLFDKHKKIAKIAFPLWLYVAVSGVVVYLMISPYY